MRHKDRERERERERREEYQEGWNEWKRIKQKEKNEITIGREKERLNFYFETDIKINYILKNRKVT